MKKILISLVSEQQIPNLLLAKEINPDEYVFISTDKMEKNKQSEKLIKTLNISKDKCKIIKVNNEDPKNIAEKIEQINFEEDELILNITGGTKLMSLIAFEIFKDKAATIYYLPIGSKEFIKLHPKKGKEKLEIKTDLTLDEYLSSYGVKLERHKTFKDEYEYEDIKKLFQKYLNGDFDKDIVNLWRNYRSKNKTLDEKEKDFLKKLEFTPKTTDKLSKDEIRFLTGGWFEEYIFWTIKKIFDKSQKKCEIATGKLLRGDVENKTDNDNEIDVLVIYENNLYFIECKTSLMDNDKSIASETIYKSRAILKDLGLTPKSALLTLEEKIYDNERKIKETLLKRANYFGVELFDRDLISNDEKFEEKIKNFFKIKP